ncbi:hypothetical protein [Rufibacter ruber]|uniref:hypothetical protein n=1 Tax=Rufibacter ruber TaxID=1783499 RepID=UPI000836F0DB|nr:hypothetical protein [Rufibacter ruber]
MAGLLKEVWIDVIKDTIKEKADFLSYVTSHDEYVQNNVINMPQAGANAGIAVNRTTLPATATQRTDSNLLYTLDQYTTDPQFVSNLENFQSSYDKVKSVLSSQMDAMIERMGSLALNKFATGLPVDRVINTTGAVSGTALAPGATGTRKALILQDIIRLAQKFDEDGVSSNDRYLMLPAGMYYQLLADADIRNMSVNGFGGSTIGSGALPEILGFKILRRNVVNSYSTVSALKAFGAATATTDFLGGIAWQKDSVAKAVSGIDVYYDEKNPLFFGSVLSTEIWMGASKTRSDNKGIVALVQG